jgi:hypothetical protein
MDRISIGLSGISLRYKKELGQIHSGLLGNDSSASKLFFNRADDDLNRVVVSTGMLQLVTVTPLLWAGVFEGKDGRGNHGARFCRHQSLL